MPTTIPGVHDSRSFENYARQYFSQLWGTELCGRSVTVANQVPWKFDLVSEDKKIVGDAKYYTNIVTPAAKWSAISEYIWLLQKIPDARVFLVFGRDKEVPERYLQRRRSLTLPVEFYFLDGTGHYRL